MGTCKLAGLVFSAILLSSLPALAQSITGTILGTIYDASGSVVPNAKVVATNTAQGWTRETNSDGLGNYIFNQLPPGPYKVNVTAAGFQTLAVAPFELLVDQRARVDADVVTSGRAASRDTGFRFGCAGLHLRLGHGRRLEKLRSDTHHAIAENARDHASGIAGKQGA